MPSTQKMFGTAILICLSSDHKFLGRHFNAVFFYISAKKPECEIVFLTETVFLKGVIVRMNNFVIGLQKTVFIISLLRHFIPLEICPIKPRKMK
jgi:hypothetical protein